MTRLRARTGIAVLAVALFLTACSGGGTDRDATALLDAYLAAVAAGDVDAAVGLFADDATWEFNGLTVQFGEPLPDDLAWLPAVLGLPEPATPGDIVEGVTLFLTTMGTTPSADSCRATEAKLLHQRALAKLFPHPRPYQRLQIC